MKLPFLSWLPHRWSYFHIVKLQNNWKLSENISEKSVFEKQPSETHRSNPCLKDCTLNSLNWYWIIKSWRAEVQNTFILAKHGMLETSVEVLDSLFFLQLFSFWFEAYKSLWGHLCVLWEMFEREEEALTVLAALHLKQFNSQGGEWSARENKGRDWRHRQHCGQPTYSEATMNHWEYLQMTTSWSNLMVIVIQALDWLNPLRPMGLLSLLIIVTLFVKHFSKRSYKAVYKDKKNKR